MADKYLELNAAGRPQQKEPATTGGAGQAGKIIALGNDGLVPPSMLGSVGTPSLSVTAFENLAAGDYINLYYTGGTVQARKANATDATLPAHGYVLSGVSTGNSVDVYADGFNSQIPQGSLTTADIGKRVFLSDTTPGGVTLTAPTSTTGRLVQCLGVIFSIAGSLVTVDTEINDGIVA